jgi:hypothetical protein
MGELHTLKFTVGTVQWEVLKVRDAIFAAFGKPGEPMPSPQLAGLAARLGKPE